MLLLLLQDFSLLHQLLLALSHDITLPAVPIAAAVRSRHFGQYFVPYAIEFEIDLLELREVSIYKVLLALVAPLAFEIELLLEDKGHLCTMQPLLLFIEHIESLPILSLLFF